MRRCFFSSAVAAMTGARAYCSASPLHCRSTCYRTSDLVVNRPLRVALVTPKGGGAKTKTFCDGWRLKAKIQTYFRATPAANLLNDDVFASRSKAAVNNPMRDDPSEGAD